MCVRPGGGWRWLVAAPYTLLSCKVEIKQQKSYYFSLQLNTSHTSCGKLNTYYNFQINGYLYLCQSSCWSPPGCCCCQFHRVHCHPWCPPWYPHWPPCHRHPWSWGSLTRASRAACGQPRTGPRPSPSTRTHHTSQLSSAQLRLETVNSRTVTASTGSYFNSIVMVFHMSLVETYC